MIILKHKYNIEKSKVFNINISEKLPDSRGKEDHQKRNENEACIRVLTGTMAVWLVVGVEGGVSVTLMN